MRGSKEDKAASHARIVDVAARRMRESGTDGPGVAEIMREAGLTHGGFYKHFDSREELVAEAVEHALGAGGARVAEVTAGAEDPLRAFVDDYLSTGHRDDPGTGCGVVALAGDMPRAGEAAREAYRTQVERYLELLERLLGDRETATVALASLVGAVSVARALGQTPRSDEILRDVRAALVG